MSSDEYPRPESLPYAYVNILCLDDIKIPFYEMLQHLVCLKGGLYTLTCYSYAEVAYYVEQVHTLSDKLKISSIDFEDEEASTDAMNNGFLELEVDSELTEGRESNDNTN